MMLRVGLLLLGLIAATLVVVSALTNGKVEPESNVSYSFESLVDGTLERKPARGGAEYAQAFVKDTAWINSLILYPFVTPSFRATIPHFLQSWLRNYIAGIFIYFASGALWCLWVYYFRKDYYFPKGNIPTKEPIKMQIIVSMKAMPLYTLLPSLSEHAIEKGWTRAFSEISEVGWPNYVMYIILYMCFVEFGIYWMHRGLHDIKPLYKLLHATHHIYNKENTMSPFAGLAFNPFDGILQACPHVIGLFVVPMHFFTHLFLFFCEAIWTTNIHDCIDGNVFAIMGAAYHTIHHTTYRHNYGHYTVFMDWLMGTLRDPEERKLKDEKSS
ncbi:hypothetical protein R1sor_013360 [Riccia sorocarpa]|uniref:Fatty acid hydroxylase domain-containing protein n=1 Tax=Riccia sorocarpa TaxID=122646 RepID=A0ABD3H868_9MARC